MSETILEVQNLTVEFATYGGNVKAVRGVDFHVQQGETLAIVGESGCGKSVTVQSIMGIIPMPPGKITAGSAKLKGKEILGLSAREANKFRGVEIGMIFQDPMTSLNPTMTIGDQIAETLMVHRNVSKAEGRRKAISLLEKTHIPEAEKRAAQYPFEFSGGMLQRAMIAQSLACNPTILIADEPTTALDVTIQAQILELMQELQRTENMSIILITHDLAVVAKMADRVAVMSDRNKRLTPIEGSPPDLFSPPKGCGYFARCPNAMKLCEDHQPPEQIIAKESNHTSRCWLQHPDAPSVDGLHQPEAAHAG